MVISISGADFIAVKIALHYLPPFLLVHGAVCVRRVPRRVFFPRLPVAPRQLVRYGLTMFALQFGFDFSE